eukprot:65563-Chlamydomonas_euryale.AAC.1
MAHGCECCMAHGCKCCVLPGCKCCVARGGDRLGEGYIQPWGKQKGASGLGASKRPHQALGQAEGRIRPWGKQKG